MAERIRPESAQMTRCKMFVRELLQIIDLHMLGWDLFAAERETIDRARQYVENETRGQ